ncbi:MAG: Ig-like domain-containing protein, partial [Tannerellaceae bacterium]|nr:Ig-like domain-containing protein [Tannerellaceae bacterium]
NQYCGWLGETSTEIMGAVNLHAEGTEIEVPIFTTGIALDRQTAQLNAGAGETLDLTATVYPSNATNPSVSWVSSNRRVATVSAGRVTALAAGTTTITAYTNDGYYIATCRVTATTNTGEAPTGGEVTAVQLYPGTLEMKPGEQASLTATVLPADATNKSVEWTSSHPAVAEVTVSGNVFAYAAGTATITATTADGGHKATCLVTVTTSATSIETPEATPPTMYYAAGALHLEGLEGYDCLIVNTAGQAIAAFRIQTETYSRHLPLPNGVYILSAQKGQERKIFKWVVRKGNPAY